MKILFSPQVRESERMLYEFINDTIKATHRLIERKYTDTFDFKYFGDGELEVYDPETGDSLIETELSVNPIKSAKRVDGELHIELLSFIGFDATEEERFPDWIDHTEYIPPKVGEVNGQDEMEE